MASIQRIGNFWKVRYSYYDDLKKRQFVNKSGFKTKKEAQIWASKHEVLRDNGVNLNAGKQLFSEYFVEWYHTYKEPSVAKATRLKYQYSIGLVSNYFAGKQIGNITRADYQRFLNDYANPVGKKPRSINSSEKINTQIRAAVQDAVDEGIIRRDFTKKTTIGGRPGKSKELKYLDAKDAEKLTAALEADVNFAHTTKFMALVSLQTGARFSEIAGLTWDNFSYDFKTIRINKAWNTLDKNGFTETKNEQSKRLIKITDHLSDLIAAYHQTQRIKLQELNIDNPLNLIFINQYGKVPDDTSANKTLHAVLKRIGAKDITFHGLRHTHASYLIYKGISIYYISARLGHASYSTTIRIYSHMLKEMEKSETTKTLQALSSM